MANFYNPYYFAPMPGRRIDHTHFGDFKPKPHGIFDGECINGSLSVKMTVKTPLLLPDAQHADEGANEHKTYPVRMVGDKPYISPAGVKGMLRSAFEIVTNSRLGVFNDHDELLGYRTPTKDAIKLVPARIWRSTEGNFWVSLLPGTSAIGDDGRPDEEPPPLMYAAFYHIYDTVTKQPIDGKILPKHGKKVWFTASRQFDRRGNRYEFWIVDQISETEPQGKEWRQGWFFKSGPNAGNKHYEKVFFVDSPSNSFKIRLGAEDGPVLKKARALLKNYRDNEEWKSSPNSGPSVLTATNPNCKWSRHFGDNKSFAAGDLCYAAVSWNASRRKWDVNALYPVQISREVSQCSPRNMVKDGVQQHHLPAEQYDNLSPAERVFGWVNDGKGIDKLNAYKGNVRIGSVELEGNDNQVEQFAALPLAILGAPKPEQARFYIRDSEGLPQTGHRRAVEYSSGKMLSGRKIYPHQQHGKDYWHSNGDSSFFRQPAGPDEKTNQNRSIKGWVKHGAEFHFTIHFSNLTKVELGALIWLLDMPADHFHKLGGGKPLGFGSVRLELVENECVLATGARMKEYYGILTASLDAGVGIEDAKAAFETEIKNAYGKDGKAPDFIEAFLCSAKGFPGSETHYPRTDRNRSADIFEWFAENEKESKLPLPAIADGDPRLPLVPNVQSNQHDLYPIPWRVC